MQFHCESPQVPAPSSLPSPGRNFLCQNPLSYCGFLAHEVPRQLQYQPEAPLLRLSTPCGLRSQFLVQNSRSQSPSHCCLSGSRPLPQPRCPRRTRQLPCGRERDFQFSEFLQSASESFQNVRDHLAVLQFRPSGKQMPPLPPRSTDAPARKGSLTVSDNTLPSTVFHPSVL